MLRDGAEVRIPAGELPVGDVIVVRPGERVATDGVVTDGTSALDTSAMTENWCLTDIRPEVLGGRSPTVIAGAAPLSAPPTPSWRGMARMVADAQVGSGSIQRLAGPRLGGARAGPFWRRRR